MHAQKVTVVCGVCCSQNGKNKDQGPIDPTTEGDDEVQETRFDPKRERVEDALDRDDPLHTPKVDHSNSTKKQRRTENRVDNTPLCAKVITSQRHIDQQVQSVKRRICTDDDDDDDDDDGRGTTYSKKQFYQSLFMMSSEQVNRHKMLREWVPEEVYHKQHGSCLCGKAPITERCVIRNTITGLTTEVGNTCIARFDSKEMHNLGQKMPGIFAGLKRISNDILGNCGENACTYARSMLWINAWEHEWYQNTAKKRKLSHDQVCIQARNVAAAIWWNGC